MTYGFRPEEVHLDPEGAALHLPLLLTERIGARNILHLGDQDAVRAVFPAGALLPAGGTVRFAPAEASVRLFDTASGQAIRGK